LPHVNGKCNHTSGRRHVGPQPQCPIVTCTDDSDCVSVTNCTWCRDDVPGAGHPQLCGGPPSPTDCGTLPVAAQYPDKVQYECFGDSVSKGIFKNLSGMVPEWEAFHPSSNEGGGCGNTVRGKDCTPMWLEGSTSTSTSRTPPVDRKWKIVTFNYGLHDLAQDGERLSTTEYKKNLQNITKVLAAAEGSPTIFWISSTPVPNVALNPARKQSDVPLYNAAAAEVMSSFKIPTIDLYSFVIKQCGNNPHYTSCPGFQLKGNVHFEPAGYQAMASFIIDSIKNATATTARLMPAAAQTRG